MERGRYGKIEGDCGEMWGDILLAKMVAVVTVKDDKGVSSEAMRI